MNDLLDITHKVIPVTVVNAGSTTPFDAFTDGQHYFFDDANAARIGAHLTGRLDLAGRPVRIERTESGWSELRGSQARAVHLREVAGRSVYRFDDEWLFAVAMPHQRPVTY